MGAPGADVRPASPREARKAHEHRTRPCSPRPRSSARWRWPLATPRPNVAPAGRQLREVLRHRQAAGKNDCAAGVHSCAGQATKDIDKTSFVFLPKGACSKIAGGSLTAGSKLERPMLTRRRHGASRRSPIPAASRDRAALSASRPRC